MIKDRVNESLKNKKPKDSKASTEYLDFLVSYIDVFADSTGLTHDEATEIFVNFSNNLPDLFQDIEDSIAEDNPEKLGRLAHRLKGTSGTLKIAPIFDFASKLEDAAREQDREECERIFQEVQKIFHRDS